MSNTNKDVMCELIRKAANLIGVMAAEEAIEHLPNALVMDEEVKSAVRDGLVSGFIEVIDASKIGIGK